MSYDEALFQMYLGQVPMFGACSQKELSAVARRAAPRALDADTVIVREGDVGNEFYVLMAGSASVSRQGHDVAKLNAGDFFGEHALFDPAPRNDTITTDAPATMAVLERDEFQATLDEVPALRDALLRGMARRLHELDARA